MQEGDGSPKDESESLVSGRTSGRRSRSTVLWLRLVFRSRESSGIFQKTTWEVHMAATFPEEVNCWPIED